MSGMEHAIERPPIVELAESFKGDGSVHDATVLLMRTWGECDPPSGVSQHPASYVATFVDMARALAAAGLLAPAPLREEWGIEGPDGEQVKCASPQSASINATTEGWRMIRRYRTDWTHFDPSRRAEGDGRADL